MKTCKHCNSSSEDVPWADKRKTSTGQLRGLVCQKCASEAYAAMYNTPAGRLAANLASANSMKKARKTIKGLTAQNIAKAKYHKKFYGKNALYTVRIRLRALVIASLALKGYTKTSRTHEILGASFEEVMQHLGCPNGIPEGYELDHILPMALAYDEASAIKLNHYTNLQLLTKAANLEKRDKLPDGRNARDLSIEEKKELVWAI